MKTIIAKQNEEYLREAALRFRSARKVGALTGAGISVASGIPDFRSPGGLWTIFAPQEYATIEVFRRNPEKAWRLYRALGKGLLGKEPNPAHQVLAELEGKGLLQGVVTQNVDGLHQRAGSKNVIEIHGDHQHLHCLRCGFLEEVREEHYLGPAMPTCSDCGTPLKPNVVLFGEGVRHLEAIDALITGCDLLLVIGTSAQVYPAAGLPEMVRDRGGLIFEFNLEPALAGAHSFSFSGSSDYFFAGDSAITLPRFCQAVTRAG